MYRIFGIPCRCKRNIFARLFLPDPWQKEQTNGPVPDPWQEEHSFAIALPVKASTPAVVANHFKALRRLILATILTPVR